MISPDIEVRLPLPQLSYAGLPVVDVVISLTVSGAAAREADKARMKLFDGLGKVGSKSVFAATESVAWEE